MSSALELRGNFLRTAKSSQISRVSLRGIAGTPARRQAYMIQICIVVMTRAALVEHTLHMRRVTLSPRANPSILGTRLRLSASRGRSKRPR